VVLGGLTVLLPAAIAVAPQLRVDRRHGYDRTFKENLRVRIL
jgi:hypothetical protein